MKHLSKLSKFVCTVLLLAGQANLFTGCSDDMPAESYYTFTGETVSYTHLTLPTTERV